MGRVYTLNGTPAVLFVQLIHMSLNKYLSLQVTSESKCDSAECIVDI